MQKNLAYILLLQLIISTLYLCDNIITHSNEIKSDYGRMLGSSSYFNDLPVCYDKNHIQFNLSIPMWSWGLAWSCCSVFPRLIGKFTPPFEGGYEGDPSYFYQQPHPLPNQSIVYVAARDFSSFLPKFLSLPASHRIILMTGLEDIGVPFELWHPNRTRNGYQLSHLWPTGQQVSMRTFLRDSRLFLWYVQNFDLIGCTSHYCSNVGYDEKDIIKKVVAIPIGLDLHSFSLKGIEKEVIRYNSKKMDSNSMQTTTTTTRGWIIGLDVFPPITTEDDLSMLHPYYRHPARGPGICQQLAVIQDITATMPPFHMKPLLVLSEFNCKFELRTQEGRDRDVTRGQLCHLLAASPSHSSPSYSSKHIRHHSSSRGSRSEFWRSLGSYAFALAPAGHGIDTHRLWEILQMQSVPIVVTSTLDVLYSQLPVIIAQNWSEVFQPNILSRYKENIQQRFGENPFAQESVKSKLTLLYWRKLIQSSFDRFS